MDDEPPEWIQKIMMVGVYLAISALYVVSLE